MPSINPFTALLHESRSHRRMFKRVDPITLELNIDNSTLEKLLTCPRSFEFYLVFGRDTGHRDALNYGTAIHLALEHYFKSGHDSTELNQILCDHFDANPPSENSWRNLDHAIESIRRYVSLREQMQKWNPIEYQGKKAVEICFSLPLFQWTNPDAHLPYPSSLIVDSCDEEEFTRCHFINVNYTGKIDLAVECNSGGDPRNYDIIDHKTTSIGGPTFWKQFYLSAQMRGYTWAATQLFDHAPCHTIIDCIVGRGPSLKGKGVMHEIEQQSYTYSQDSINEWRDNVTDHIRVMLNRLSRGFFPEANTHCVNKFGMCDYHDVCTQPMNSRQLILASGQYADRTWSPVP